MKINDNKMFKGKGEIYFYPKKYSNKAWAILNCDQELVEYYTSFFCKRFGIHKLQKPKHGSHITVIREEEISDEVYDTLWGKNQYKEIEFQYSNEIKTNGEHIWLPVISEELLNLREEMGLNKH